MEQPQQKQTKSKIFKKTSVKVAAGVIATMTGFPAITVAPAIIAYDAFVTRCNRPNYKLYLGDYCYDRVKDRLSRDEFFFTPNGVRLKGYYYPAKQGKALVVFAHGFRAGADDYLPIFEYLVARGYNVFAYDCTGTYDSDGKDMVGMCQSLVDLDAVLKYVKSTPPYAGQKLLLAGHSWGGYAVASALELHKDVRACACIAPMNNGYTIMQEKAQASVGKVSAVAKPIFSAYQRLLFKRYVNYNGLRGINSVEIPVLIAQGIEDTTITYDGQSIMAHRDEITNPNVTYYEGEGLQGDHDNVWHSIDAVVYQNKVASGLKRLEMQKGESLTDQEKADFYQTVNNTLYSQVNGELMEQIVQMFDAAITQ